MTLLPAATAHPSVWAAVRSFDGTVGSLVPPVFSSYARVFHPAFLAGKPVSWRAVAQASGRVMHPLAQWRRLNPGSDPRDLSSLRARPGVWDEEPSLGTLPTFVAARLAFVLGARTTTSDSCWFAVWGGYGGLDPHWTQAPRFSLPGRDMHLLSGPVSAVAHSLSDGELHANLWWPSDHAWCVATDVDMVTTYVGGGVDVIAAVLADPELEALPVGADDSVTWESDAINVLN